jgi:uncharacterized protein involved in exopolysaccharide biosynthesis
MTKVPLHPIPEDPSPAEAQADADLFDYAAIKQWMGFIFRSLKRHRLIGASAGVAVLALAIFLAWVIPKKFESRAKLLANRNSMMASLGNPHRANNFDNDGPTRAAQETVMARDNLVSMVKQTKLLEHWEAHRHPVMRLKDSMMRAIGGEQSDDQKLDNMIGTLEKRLNVYTGDGTVIIEIYWPDAAMARQLVETAQQNFLEARHVSEVSAISETISILEMHASETQTAIEEAVANVQKVADERRGVAKKEVKDLKAAVQAANAAPPRKLPAANANETPTQELSQLKFLIRTKRRAIQDLEEFRNHRLTELQGQLAEQKVIYSANHPVIVDIEQRIDALQKESPQIENLKRDEAGLIEEYKSRGGRDVNAATEPGSSTSTVRRNDFDSDAVLREVMPDLRDDPAVSVARAQLAMATSRYQDILMRIDAARIELDTARAAFKYRYTVVSPAQTPRNPIGPNVMLIVIGGILAGLFFSFFASTALDLWKGRVVESWQVEKRLKLPVLAEVKL